MGEGLDLGPLIAGQREQDDVPGASLGESLQCGGALAGGADDGQLIYPLGLEQVAGAVLRGIVQARTSFSPAVK